MRVPTLFLSGLADQLIPPNMMMELYQVRCHHALVQGHHNDMFVCRVVGLN